MRGTLIFDGTCGFCTRSRNLLARLDRHDRVRTVPSQRAGVAERAGTTRTALDSAVCWLTAEESGAGTRYWGAEAINAALGAALGTTIPLRLYRLPGIRRIQDAVYDVIADNRHRLPGTTPWCTAHPEDCDDGADDRGEP